MMVCEKLSGRVKIKDLRRLMASTASAQTFLENFRPPHPREAWNPPVCATALIHTKLGVLTGKEDGGSSKQSAVSKLYEAAKLNADFDAATKLIDIVWRNVVLDELVSLVLSGGVRPIIAFPHPGFDDDDAIDHDAGSRVSSKNAIPFAYAARLRIALNGLENTSIKQASRVGRTKLHRFPRFLYQPSFVGAVDTDRPYILVDDTLTLGGTLAVMRSHIVRNGGTVIAVSALAHSLGQNIAFAQRQVTHNSLLELYGSELVDFWRGEIGHEPIRLTDAEARFLCEWAAAVPERTRGSAALLLALRTRLDRARAMCR
ncbi:MAG: phosphoribosyltransferase [Gluconobacter cerinus]|uniref:phosphoribosyltransferase n=1 Tax=Gluconobacter cerinus TaxID=38307 RepID=UPI0039E9BB8A